MSDVTRTANAAPKETDVKEVALRGLQGDEAEALIALETALGSNRNAWLRAITLLTSRFAQASQRFGWQELPPKHRG